MTTKLHSRFDAVEFVNCYPIAFLMREQNLDWWFRIHSLPESTRYPECEADWSTLHHRHRSLADRVLCIKSRCRITYAQFSGFPLPRTKLPPLDWRPMRRIESGGDELDTWVATEPWDYDYFRPWLEARAQDAIAFIGFHSLTTDSLYMPYDGGADVFSLDPFFLGDIRATFSEWKSPLESGL